MRRTRPTARSTGRGSSSCRARGTERMGRGRMLRALVSAWTCLAVPAAAQGDTALAAASPTDTTQVSAQTAPQPAVRFSQEAGLGLRALWEQSLAAQQERVACLGASIRNDTVFVDHILALAPE